jgi:cytochrome P450
MPRFADASEAAQAARAFDLKRLPPDFIADPYPCYRALRQHDPVHRMPDGSYFITRHDDCEALYKDARSDIGVGAICSRKRIWRKRQR